MPKTNTGTTPNHLKRALSGTQFLVDAKKTAKSSTANLSDDINSVATYNTRATAQAQQSGSSTASVASVRVHEDPRTHASKTNRTRMDATAHYIESPASPAP